MVHPNGDDEDDIYSSECERSDALSDSGSDQSTASEALSTGTITERRGLTDGPDDSDSEPPASPHYYQPSFSYSHKSLPKANVLLRPAQFPETGDSFATKAALETPAVITSRGDCKNPSASHQQKQDVHQARAAPFDHQEDDGKVRSTASTQDVHNAPQHGTGPTRTKKVYRFPPYKRCSTPATEPVGEVEPPISPPCIPSAGSPTTQPSGVTSETTANAEKKPTKTKEGKAKVSKRTRQPAVRPRVHRIKTQEGAATLVRWAQNRSKPPRTMSFNEALAAAIKAISTIKGMKSKPRLIIGEAKDDEAVSEAARKERIRRGAERDLYQDLSRYYPRDQGMWSRPKLLSKLLEDLENHPAL